MSVCECGRTLNLWGDMIQGYTQNSVTEIKEFNNCQQIRLIDTGQKIRGSLGGRLHKTSQATGWDDMKSWSFMPNPWN